MESSLRFVEFKFASKESSLRLVEFKFAFGGIKFAFGEIKFAFGGIKFAFGGIQVCIKRIKFAFDGIQVCVWWNSSLRLVKSSLRLVESTLRFMESSLCFVNSSFYRKNQVFENACELHRTRYMRSCCVQPQILQPTRITDHLATFKHFTISGNIIYTISDHLPNFLIFDKFSSLSNSVKLFHNIY